MHLTKTLSFNYSQVICKYISRYPFTVDSFFILSIISKEMIMFLIISGVVDFK